MSQIGVVNVKFLSSVGGLTSGVDAAGKAFKALGGDTATLRSSLAALNNISKQGFLEIGPVAGTARAAFDGISASVEALVVNFRSGSASAEQFAARMSALTAEARQMAQAASEAAAITRENTTAEQDYFATLDRVANAVRNGGLAEEVAARAREAALATYLRATEAIDTQADALSRLGGVVGNLGGAADANPVAGIADAFAASVTASDSFIAATTGVEEALAQQAVASDIARIAEEQRLALVARGAEIERSVASAAQVHAAAIEELDVLQNAGAISATAYAAAVERQNQILAEADGSAAAASAALSDLAAAHQRGAAVTRGNMTAQEQYSARVADLRDLLSRGAISQETFSRAVSAAAAEMRKSGTAASDMSSGLAGISSRLNILIGLDVARLFGSIASTVSNTVSSFVRMGAAEAGVIDQTSKLAARLNVTYGEMAGLSLAAEKNGVSMESMKDAMTKADVAFVNAANGSASAAAAFDRIGLSAAQLNGMGTADRFQEIAKSIAALPTEAERAAAATQIFGRSGADLLPLFAGGAEGIARAREEADRLGLSLTNAQGQDVQKMVSSFETAQNAIQGVVQQVTAYLSPAITGVVEQFNTFIGDIGGANIGAMIGEGILAGAEYLAGVADWLVANFGSTFEYFSQIGAQWSAVGDVLNRVGAFLSGVFNTAAAGFRLVILGITGSFETLATIAQQIGQYLGFDTASLDVVVAAAKGFNDELQNGINQNLTAAKEGFGTALFGDAEQAGQAIARPFTSAVQTARDAARQSAAAVDTAKQEPIEIEKTVEIASINEALKGIDSRSSEGVSEMFRLMRGQGGDVQHRQLAALEQIADNTSGGDDTYPFALGY
ncbi:MAG: hypothetical protein RLZZ21_1407 [Planctomycetota bacterium]|jgi:hypothetical protein